MSKQFDQLTSIDQFTCPYERGGALANCVERCVDNIHRKCVVRPIYELVLAFQGGLECPKAIHCSGDSCSSGSWLIEP